MAKDPNERLPTMEALAEGLASFVGMDTEPTVAHPTPSQASGGAMTTPFSLIRVTAARDPKRPWLLVAGGALAITGLIGFGLAAFGGSDAGSDSSTNSGSSTDNAAPGGEGTPAAPPAAVTRDAERDAGPPAAPAPVADRPIREAVPVGNQGARPGKRPGKRPRPATAMTGMGQGMDSPGSMGSPTLIGGVPIGEDVPF